MPESSLLSSKQNSEAVEDLELQVVDFLKMPDQRPRWDQFVISHPQGTTFHLAAWQNVIQSTFGHEAHHAVAINVSCGDILGVLPLFYVRSKIFGKMLVSTPQAAYGGILSNSSAATAVLYRHASQLAQQIGVQFLELRSFGNTLNDPSLLARDLYVTFRHELFQDSEKNYLAIPRKTRAEIREGIRNGLEFRVNGIGVDEFFNIYSQSVRELGTPVFPKRLFAHGMHEFGADCKIFSVHWKRMTVAAVWTLFYKDEVVPYFGGSVKAYNHLAVNNFMYWMLMKYGCENGYRVFDFGRSKKGTGSFNFKKRWGMVMSDLPYQYLLVRGGSLPDTSPLNPKYSLGIRVWRRLPLWVANTIGPMISRHLI
jgi:FemAB-related protein (PEP-CTERM system-associated)